MRGLERALARLSALPEQAERAAELAARESADKALQAARSLSPVRTGALRASLKAQSLPRGAAVRTNCPYALLVERGGRHTPARPFLAPAAKAADFPSLLSRALKEAIK